MEDSQIIALFFQRSERAISELSAKYDPLCMRLSMNILHSREDAEECVSDAYRAVWERIPPERPTALSAFLSRIVRNISYSKLDYITASKRDERCNLCLSELEDCLPSGESIEQALEAKQISAVINAFLSGLDKINRIIFVRRYFYFDSCKDIGKMVGLSQGAVHTRLSRMRTVLKEQLEKEEIML